MLDRIKKTLRGMDKKLIVSVALAVLLLLIATLVAGYLAYDFHNQLLLEQAKVTFFQKQANLYQEQANLYKYCIEGVNSGEITPDVILRNGEVLINFNCK